VHRYKLLFPKDEIDPVVDIIQIVKTVTDVYLKDEQKLAFTDPNTGIIRQLEKAGNNLKKNKTDQVLLDIFKKAVDAYNSAITDLIKDGALAENLDSIHHLPLAMVRVILNQVYERAVSPTIEDLSKYTNGTDEVYGELLPPFVSRVLGEVGLKSDQVFIDLGSGVGNVVLQAALEFGCESWGCEMMVNACNLAEAQQKEFAARCRLWGLQSGEVHLERGNFLENTKIHKAMQRADVILVNNEVFQETTNRDLVHLFLDLKDGCKIVSLKPFLAVSRNKNDPANILEIVEKGDIYSEDVSWTARGQNYYISTKDSGRLQAFHD
jgi:H3 lysine-79-specific histone-lysine N-methyltransferase